MQGLKTVAKAGGAATDREAERIVDFTCVKQRTLNTEIVNRLESPLWSGIEAPEHCSLLQLVIISAVYSVDDL